MSNVLIGAAIGDALGVFAESQTSDYQPLLDWDGESFIGSEYHGLKPGQFSDDSQMSIMVAESLIQNQGFNGDDLAARYIDWIESGIARGYGKTTYCAIQKLKDGVSWKDSGVEGSYGNGTAMRAAPFGIYFRHDFNALIDAVSNDSNMTHKSDEALAGALAIAIATYMIVNHGPSDNLLQSVLFYLPKSRVKEKLSILPKLLESKADVRVIYQILGVRADVRMTVPSVLYSFLKFKNYKEALPLVQAGGDTDTNFSILCALYGARDGAKHFSEMHLANVEDGNNLIVLDNKLMSRDSDNLFPIA